MDTQAYQDAKDALKVQEYIVAERYFKIVLDSIDEHHEQYNSVLSYDGLSQVLVSNNNGLLLCREAAGNEVVDGDIFLNLACAELESGNRIRIAQTSLSFSGGFWPVSLPFFQGVRRGLSCVRYNMAVLHLVMGTY